MVRAKDKFWEHVEEMVGRFRCKFCQKEFPGGIARIKSHLSGQKGRAIAVCEQVPEDVQAAALYAIRSFKKAKTGSPIGKETSISSTASNRSMEKHFIQTTEDIKKRDKDHVDKIVTECFVMNNIALNVIQSHSFMTMVKAISDYGGTYVLPSHSTLRSKLIPNIRNDVAKYVLEVKESWAITGCTIMSNMWTDIKEKFVINVMASSPRGGIFLRSFEKSAERKTGLFLKEILLEAIEEIGQQNVVQIVIDNASNSEVACDLIAEKYPHIYRIKCAAQGVQLLLKDIYKEVAWVQKVFEDAKLVVDYMYKHQIVLSLMRSHINGKELKRYCKTRFASYFLMLQSVVEVENELRLLVASSEWRGVSYNKSTLAQTTTEIIQSELFWTRGREVLSLLEPLMKVLCLVDGDGSTGGYLYEAMEGIRSTIMEKIDIEPQKYAKILELFEVRRQQDILHQVHAVAAFLNPPYMYSGKIRYDNFEVREGMNFIIQSLVGIDERGQFAWELVMYNNKRVELFTPLATAMLNETHPRNWWQLNGGVTPILQRVAIRILSQPCSSSGCERNCSAFETTQIKKKSKLSPIMLEDLVSVKMNLMMMSNARNFAVHNDDVINLDCLGELQEEIDDDRDGFEETTDQVLEVS